MKPKETGPPTEEPYDVVEKVPFIMRYFQSHDPCNVIETQVGNDTVTSGDPPVTLYSHPIGPHTSIPPTLKVLSYVKSLPTQEYYRDTTSTKPEVPHTQNRTQGLTHVTGTSLRCSDVYDHSPKYTHRLKKVPIRMSSATTPTPDESQRMRGPRVG